MDREQARGFLPDLGRLPEIGQSLIPDLRRMVGSFGPSLGRSMTQLNLLPDFRSKAPSIPTAAPMILPDLGFLPSQRSTFNPSLAQSQPLIPGGSTSPTPPLQLPWLSLKPETPTNPNMPGSGAIGTASGEYAILEQYNSAFLSAAASEGLDPNMLKAIAMVERGWEGTSPAGATGIMQIMTDIWADTIQGLNPNDPEDSILAGAKIFKSLLNQYGGDIDSAIQAYHGWGHDGYTSNTEYLDAVKMHWNNLQSTTPTTGGSVQAGAFSAVWGGRGNYPITQEIGGHAMDYSYGIELGVGNSHPGIDIGMPENTPLYFAWSGGTVISPTGYFCYWDYGCGNGQGELRIQLDNGDIVIYGHMKNISVPVGTRLTPGQMVGFSGAAGSGAHLHLEYRARQPGGNYLAVDPRSRLG